jgi:hypothetical protein
MKRSQPRRAEEYGCRMPNATKTGTRSLPETTRVESPAARTWAPSRFAVRCTRPLEASGLIRCPLLLTLRTKESWSLQGPNAGEVRDRALTGTRAQAGAYAMSVRRTSFAQPLQPRGRVGSRDVLSETPRGRCPAGLSDGAARRWGARRGCSGATCRSRPPRRAPPSPYRRTAALPPSPPRYSSARPADPGPKFSGVLESPGRSAACPGCPTPASSTPASSSEWLTFPKGDLAKVDSGRI